MTRVQGCNFIVFANSTESPPVAISNNWSPDKSSFKFGEQFEFSRSSLNKSTLSTLSLLGKSSIRENCILTVKSQHEEICKPYVVDLGVPYSRNNSPKYIETNIDAPNDQIVYIPPSDSRKNSCNSLPPFVAIGEVNLCLVGVLGITNGGKELQEFFLLSEGGIYTIWSLGASIFRQVL
jgi:hypothetical protein